MSLIWYSSMAFEFKTWNAYEVSDMIFSYINAKCNINYHNSKSLTILKGKEECAFLVVRTLLNAKRNHRFVSQSKWGWSKTYIIFLRNKRTWHILRCIVCGLVFIKSSVQTSLKGVEGGSHLCGWFTLPHGDNSLPLCNSLYVVSNSI